MKFVALLGLVSGLAYIVLAIVASGRGRRPLSNAEKTDSVVFAFEQTALLIEGEPTRERMRKLATLCATTALRSFKLEFDYSPESVGRLERAIMIGWGGGEPNMLESVDPRVLVSFGAYIGEVLVRRTNGRWVTGMADNDPGNVLFLASGGDTVSVSPFLLVREKFGNMYGFDLSIAFTALEQKLTELHVA